MKTLFALAAMVAFPFLLHAEMQAPVPLWPDGAPGAHGSTSNDIPTLTPYLPDSTNATGAAMVICPGGAYGYLAPHEGNDYAVWLNQHGVTCFVLKYRLGSQWLPASGHAGRRGARGAPGAGEGGGLEN